MAPKAAAPVTSERRTAAETHSMHSQVLHGTVHRKSPPPNHK
ncbi:MAG TPA: hypothetical protein VGS97_25975 [Actinocrinis sp.]|nr:hypothetical protein [Actinocrinis sp.]HEV2347566.1 hypothetical protein [Actinocrinis sp.]